MKMDNSICKNPMNIYEVTYLTAVYIILIFILLPKITKLNASKEKVRLNLGHNL